MPECLPLHTCVCMYVCMYVYIYIYIYIYIYNMLRRAATRLGRHHLSHAACLTQASFVWCVAYSVKDHHHHLPNYSRLVKKSCVRQVVLDKWFPLSDVTRCGLTPSPPIKSLDFREFDSSRLLIIRGGNSHVRWILEGVSRKVWLKDSS